MVRSDRGKNAKLISAENLLGKNQFDLDGGNRKLSKGTFWYYTSIDTASKILDNRNFRASNLKRMNDKAEAERHKSVDDKVHALCFCNSDKEKIPMWYMYGGITGKGVAIGLTSAVMLKFIKSIDIIQNPDIDGNEKFLRRGKDFDIQIGQVFYANSPQIINFRRKWYRISKDDIGRFNKDNYFIKDYPWEYEKEFRIVIKTKESCDQVDIFMPEDMISNLKIKFAPEIKRDDIWETLNEYEGFRKYYESRFLYSSLNIDMALAKRNLREMGSYLEQLKENDIEEYAYTLKKLGIHE